jgi:hypothetical protein
MDNLRKPFFLVALVLMVIIVLVEVGSTAVLHLKPDAQALNSAKQAAFSQLSDDERGEIDEAQWNSLANRDKPPGRGIPYLALIDGLLLFTVILMGASLLVPGRVQGRLQGIATLIVAILSLCGGIAIIFAAIAILLIMVALFLSVPFGTIAYLALYGFFDRAGASVALSLLMTLKIGFAICLVLAQQRFLQNRGLVLLIITSFIGNIIVSFLHGLVPIILVSITDTLAAIIVAIIAVIWALVLLIGSLNSILKTIQLRA